MKLSITLLLLLSSTMFVNAQDWAKLEFYKERNMLIAPPKPDEYRIVFMGNSITQGWDKHYPDFFQRNASYINRGIGGQTTPQMLVRFRQDVIELSPRLVVLMAGTNDIAGNTGPMSLEMTFGTIVSMVELAKVNNIEVILCSVLPAKDFPWRKDRNPAEKIFELNNMLKEYAKIKGIYYVDFYKVMVNNELGLMAEYTYDGVHPNKEGYQLMEPIIQKAINDLIVK